MKLRRGINIWRLAFWILLFAWTIGAGLYMAQVQGGFLTNYLSDLAFPPWFYIYIRGLWKSDGEIPKVLIFRKWFGLSPERALFSILIIGIITEVKTLYWPNGPITGTFDALDILAYGMGLMICYIFDKRFKKLHDKSGT